MQQMRDLLSLLHPRLGTWSRPWVLILLAAATGLSSASAYQDYYPGRLQLIAGSGPGGYPGGANPFFYPTGPLAPPRGSATFLPPSSWDAVTNNQLGPGVPGAPGVPGLYASRYAASALPAHASPLPHAHEPAQRFYSDSGRGRPAMIPTPYAKYSTGTNKQALALVSNALSASSFQGLLNAVDVPEPGFYGRAGPGSPNAVRGLQGHGPAAYHDKTAVGFYGKALK